MDGIQALEETSGSRSRKQTLPAQTAPEMTEEMNKAKPVLAEMVSLLETDVTEAMNRLEALRGYLEHSLLREDFIRLEKQVEGFDTDSALKTLEKMLRTVDQGAAPPR